jgi:lipopolysaccharide transport system ATP-binding protein
MSDTVIKVDNLSKKYILSHQSQERYMVLRDVMARVAKNLGKKLISSLAGHHSSLPASKEEFFALKDVSFEIKQGDRIGIIGRNGAGKSTLLKVLSRIIEPTSGTIEITGRVASLLEVGTGFHPELTGRENIFLNGAILGMSNTEIKRKFDEIVDFAEIEKFLDTPVKRYSSGMYVRLAFAVAAHLEPEILIVDEVLAVGDAQFQKKCLGKMEDVSVEGRTVLFVSHNMAAIEQLTQHSILLSEGKVKINSKTPDVVLAYLGTSTGDSAVRFNVDKAPRKYPSNKMARFIELRFNRELSVFYLNEDFQFIARVRAYADIQNIRISITVFANDGTPVGSCFGPAFTDMKEGEETEFRITLPRPRFAPGLYFCGLAVGNGDYTTGYVDFDVVLDTLAFEVHPEAGDGGTLSQWARGWGQIIFDPLQQQIHISS